LSGKHQEARQVRGRSRGSRVFALAIAKQARNTPTGLIGKGEFEGAPERAYMPVTPLRRLFSRPQAEGKKRKSRRRRACDVVKDGNLNKAMKNEYMLIY
jgi:hypothetical protein